jgi:hypothetical protein
VLIQRMGRDRSGVRKYRPFVGHCQDAGFYPDVNSGLFLPSDLGWKLADKTATQNLNL